MRTSPSRSRDSYSGSYHGSHAAGKRPSFGLTLEDKTSTTASRKPSTAYGAYNFTKVYITENWIYCTDTDIRFRRCVVKISIEC